MNTFPILSTVGSVRGWNEHTQTSGARSTGDAFVDTEVTFNAVSFEFLLFNLTSTDKESLRTFYNNNKDKEFYWTRPRTSAVYIVAFQNVPTYTSNNDINSWNVDIEFIQTISLVA